MIAGLSIDLKSVSSFLVVQADGPENYSDTITDEKEFKKLKEALDTVLDSEAPIKYLMFNHGGETYKLKPIEDSGEFNVIRTPILH